MRIAGALLAALLLAPAPSESADVSPPEALLERHVEAFNSGDAKALAFLYAEDAKLVAADGRVIRGRRDIESFWRSQQLGVRRRLRLTGAEKETSGPLAYMIGNYSLTDPTERGTFTAFFKRGKDGSWKIAASMWNEARSVGYTPLQ